MRVVLDTNVLLSDLLWHGAPHTLLENIRSGALPLISSPALPAELTRVIGRTKFDVVLARTHTSRERSLGELQRLAEMIDPPPLPRPICRDPDDDAVLALANTAQADYIVSGDEDLLALKSYQGIPIVTPAAALRLISGG